MEYNHGKGVKHFSDADAAMRMKKEKWRTVSDMRVRRTDLCQMFVFVIILFRNVLCSFLSHKTWLIPTCNPRVSFRPTMKLSHRGLLQHKNGYNFELQRQMERIFLIAFVFSIYS